MTNNKTSCRIMKFRPAALFCGALIVILFFCLSASDFAAAAQGNSHEIALTQEERAWLAAHPEIKIGLRETPPLVMKDDRDGSLHGMSLDYIRLLEERLGMRFKLLYYDTWRDLIEGAKRKEVDVLVTAVWTPERSAWLNYTRPYIVLVNKIIVRQGSFEKVKSLEQLRGKKVGVLDGSAVHEYTKRYEGLVNVVPLKNEKMALADVSFGAIDAAVMDIARASYFIQKENITNLEIVGDLNYNYEYGLSSRKDWPVLNGLLMKGLASVSEEERESIYRKWVIPLSSPVSILTSPIFWVSVIGSGFFVFTIMLLFWNRALRHRVMKSNAELLLITEQLHQAQKMEAVGQLAGGIAHDFNNILMAIIGYADILRMKIGDDPALRVHIDRIIESANRAAHLTNDLLAFSRRRVLNPRSVDMNEVIENLKTLLNKGIGERIELKTIYREETPVYIERNQIELALINLANNARDAMPDGGTLTIETDTVEIDDSFRRANGFGKEGLYAVITVSDTGSGMDEETKLRVFEPFFTTKEVGKGTGLGLSMVYGVVKQHFGYILVESELGRGAKFTIYLPLLPAGMKVEKAPERIMDGEVRGGSETILVAEDDDVLRELKKRTLEEAGYRALEAPNGEDAIRLFNDHRDAIQLLVLDVIMPRKSGIEAFIEIRKICPDIKALFVSGYTSDKLSMASLQIKESDVLFKPVSANVLLRKVREILDRET
jgi:signal transduction histidine kinase/CheY-like chemotaxis protein